MGYAKEELSGLRTWLDSVAGSYLDSHWYTVADGAYYMLHHLLTIMSSDNIRDARTVADVAKEIVLAAQTELANAVGGEFNMLGDLHDLLSDIVRA